MRKIKDFILNKLGILKLREQNSSTQKKIKDLESRNRNLINQNEELIHRVRDLEKLIFEPRMGLNEEKRTPRIVVSLTSFPARINYVYEVLERMLIQTLKPDEIVLWLSKEQFPERENELPENLLAMRKYGIKIEWCDGDIKAYKKFIPTLKKYPDDLVVMLDDDLIYHVDLLETLYQAHKDFPNAIIASRCHEIAIDAEGKLASYKKWKKQCGYDTYKIRDDWFFTGGAGTLLPPHIFGEELFDIDSIQELCPWADDVWLNLNAAINRVPIVNTAAYNRLTRIEGTQENRLQDINLEQNDIQLKKVILHFKEKLAGTIYDKI